jgi:LAO/AO transport system kinase
MTNHPAFASVESLMDAARAGNRRALARLVSIVEDDAAGARQILALADGEAGRAAVTGITGAPGAGKSTLTDGIVDRARASGSVAVIAVDPSSPFTGGALLGDRVRMARHTEADDVYIRSMASRGALGGVASSTPRALTLLDGLGFAEIVIETVGVGQAEVDVVAAADTTVVVVTPGWGDGVQAAKAGLLEVADVFVVNKADRDGVAATVGDLQQMIALGSGRDWEPPIISTIATTGDGLDELWEAINNHRGHVAGDRAKAKRGAHRIEIFERAAAEQLAAHARQTVGDARYDQLAADVRSGKRDPWSAADMLIAELAAQ